MKMDVNYTGSTFMAEGIFESVRSYDGEIFKLDEHLDRLFESGKRSAILIPTSKSELKRLVQVRFRQSGLRNAYIRIAFARDQNSKAKLSLIIKEFNPHPKRYYCEGVSAVTVPTRKNVPEALDPKVKSLNFLNGILAKIDSRGEGIFEAILLSPEGYVAEGTVSNIFIVKKGELITPPAYVGILEGITRRTVIDIAGGLNYKVTQLPFTRHELFTADECFLTNTSVEIMPVVRVDSRFIGNGKPGEITKELLREFKMVTADFS